MLTTKLIMLFHHSETNAILDDLFVYIYINSQTVSRMKSEFLSEA